MLVDFPLFHYSYFSGLTVQLIKMGGKEISIGNFDGAVTTQELQSFNEFAASLEPAKDNIGNNWAQGDSGEQTKAMGLIYLIANEQSTLDQMIRFSDAVLSERNDLAPAPVGQHKIWTGG
jgi:hypothetical protein